jgi:4-hydroxy-tetrahydrodipicolinate synthase
MLRLTGSTPLGLYECPAPYKRILSPSVLEKLITTNRFLFHKDTSIQQDSVKAKLDLVKNRTGFEFYDAHSPNAMFSMQAGAKGMSCISANFYPEVIAWMCKNVNNPNKQDEVKWLQSELTQADPLIHIAYPMSAKYFLRKRGMPVKTISRAHALELSPAQKQALDKLYDNFNNWCARLKITQVNVEDVLLPDGRLDPAI